MVEYVFGAGAFWGNRSDTTGSGIGPDQFAVLQDVMIDFGFDIRELHGQFQFPVDIARGKGKITGKAKFARIIAAVYGDIFFGVTPTSGTTTTVAENEAQTVPAGSPYNVTTTNAASFVDDLGVFNATTGLRFVRVTSPASAGQYSVNLGSGVYTFSSADANVKVAISYLYNASSGKSITLTNQLMGFTPEFKGTFYTQKTTQGSFGAMAVVLNACWSTRLAIPTRLDDYMISELDFSAGADAAGNIGLLSMNE